jgi:type II restriction/modification system DNA methylase subunit YeeA
MEQAAQYETPFEYVKATVYPERKDNHRESYRERWWIYAEARPGMRKAIDSLKRYIATPRVSKHRLFVWQEPRVLCNDGTIVLARDDDYFFGMLQSRLHEVWARAQGTQLREVESGFRYTPSSTFETFPFPWAPGKEPQDNPLVQAIAQAASELVTKRDAWLNPPDAKPEILSKRTLTKLYNKHPSWLVEAHRKLDEAVFAAYGWPSSLTDAEVLERLLALNHQRAETNNV